MPEIHDISPEVSAIGRDCLIKIKAFEWYWRVFKCFGLCFSDLEDARKSFDKMIPFSGLINLAFSCALYQISSLLYTIINYLFFLVKKILEWNKKTLKR